MATDNKIPQWSARHVKTIAELPAKLTIGRAYFVDDEQYIIIDHGNGPVIYGQVKHGTQGAPGEPIPELQAQIDQLTQASIQSSDSLQKFNDARKKDFAALQATRTDDLITIYGQISKLSEGILEISKVLSDTCDNLRSTESIILKIIMETDTEKSIVPFETNEVITSSDGNAWTILESSGSKYDGTIIFNLNQ